MGWKAVGMFRPGNFLEHKISVRKINELKSYNESSLLNHTEQLIPRVDNNWNFLGIS